MTLRQKRELGLLPRQVLSDMRRLAKDGVITNDMTAKQVALVIAAERASEEAHEEAWESVFEGASEVDLDRWLKFIEGLVAIFLKFSLYLREAKT